ncbi:MAG: acetolactate synthase large subunit [Acidobacteria bacterium]|nr:acetolactate synthase large subunit [Acidobacteriota bacterium]
MNGAECLLRTLVGNGIEVCFMNPGTSEMQFVAALDGVPEMRGILGLEENICSGAADGYARVAERPASTLLHLGPGLANALSNLHNARKARSPIVNIIGEHATQHTAYDAPLTANTEAFAAPVSAWTYTTRSAEEVGRAASEAVRAALAPPGGVASLIVPADHSWLPSNSVGAVAGPAPRPLVEEGRIVRAAELLAAGQTALYAGGAALRPRGVEALRRIHAATGARIFVNRFSARQPRGRGREFMTRMPYFPEVAEASMAGVRHLLLVETAQPVSFFAYPNRRSTLMPLNCQAYEFALETEDSLDALERLADRFPASVLPAAAMPLPSPGGPLTVESLGAIVAAELPENAVISDEMVSSGEPANKFLAHAAPHDTLPVCGGSIGQGLPLALGAAIAAPHRKVVSLEADGSGMYTLQALWTMARERCDVVIVIFANRKYRILEIEMQRTGVAQVAPRAQTMLDIDNPTLDWTALARAMGVPAERAETCERFHDLFRNALGARGPFLIEAIL